MSDYAAFDQSRIKHLELIQAVISRLGNDSFLVKGWAVTVTGALIGFAVDRSKPGLALVGFVPVLAFWIMDTYYLRSERLFRVLYEAVRSGDGRVEAFQMNATAPEMVTKLCGAGWHQASRRATFLRPTLVVFYAGLGLAVLVAALAID